MAQSQFTILNNQPLTNATVTGNGQYDLFTSATIANNNGLPSLRLIVEFHDEVGLDLWGGISLVAEAQNNGQWFPIAYQFEHYSNPNNGKQRVIVLEPSMSTYDDGIDSVMYVAGQTVARISRQQGRVGSGFRVRLILQENGFGTERAFNNLNVSIYGELYD